MQVVKPSYYDSFRCVAAACPDSCCKEWSVQVDADSAARYRALQGPLGEHLRSVMSEEDGDIIFKLTSSQRCPMWREDSLCSIQAQLGEEYLCHTCRQFPRLRHDYGDFVELGLELSCPEAARLILGDNAPMRTVTIPGGSDPDYDIEVMAILRKSRDVAHALLDDQTLPAGKVLAVLLLYGYAVQNEIDCGEPAVLDTEAMCKSAALLKGNRK